MKLALLALCCLYPYFALAESIIVSADRIPSKLKTTSNEVYSIKDEEVLSLDGELVWKKIQQLPGVDISNTGGQGQSSTISIRGADSRHSLVLFEGIELNDASTTGNLFDLAHLSIDGVSSIELLPGSQSVLYGSDAIGGVLSLNLVDLSKVKKPYFSYSGTLGSNKSHSLGVTHYSSVKKLSYFLNASQISTDGISQTSILTDDNSEKDGHFLGTATGKFLYKISNEHNISVLSKISHSSTDIDKGFGSPRDDSNYQTKGRNFLYKIESKSELLDGQWEPIFSYSSIENKRNDEDGIDNLSSTISTFQSRFTRKKISNQNNIYLTPNDTIIAGLEYEFEKGSTQSLTSGTLSGLDESKEESKSLYLNHKKSDKIFWSTGLRAQLLDDKTEFTYKVAPGIQFKKGRTWLSYSTGFKNPSLFQKNSSSYGNKALKPEESKSLEWGGSLQASQGFDFSLVTYHLDISNLIDTSGIYPNLSYINLNRAKITGVNFTIRSRFFDMNFTRQETSDSNGFELINRPKLKTSLTGKVSLHGTKVSLTSLYKGPRDSGSTFSRTRLPGHTLFNSKVSYDFRRTMLVWLELNNLFDKRYAEVSSFNTDGFNFKIGFNWRY